MQTVDGLIINAGDIVLVEYVFNYTAAVVVGFEPGRYYGLPKEYQWSRLAGGDIELESITYLDESKAKYITILGTLELRLIPGYMEWLHGGSIPRR